MKIFFIGDVVGGVGRKVLRDHLPEVLAVHGFEDGTDAVIANCENASGGFGIGPKQVEELLGYGIHVLTSGNHIWSNKEILPYLKRDDIKLIRPFNYPPGNEGKGVYTFATGQGVRIAVVNMIGRVFMDSSVDCPFRAVEELLKTELVDYQVIFVDFHAEATSEKVAFGRFLDGRVSAVVGTHTHVQTADEQVFRTGTAYITDVGMCGPVQSVIGFEETAVIAKFLVGRTTGFKVASGESMINAVVVEIDSAGKATGIKRINERYQLGV